MRMKNGKNNCKQSVKEEIANAITHGVGALLSLAGLVILVVVACLEGQVWHVVSFTVFGSCLLVLYTASTLYHSFQSEKVKNAFRIMDHSAIYLLIAGSYTPFTLTLLRAAGDGACLSRSGCWPPVGLYSSSSLSIVSTSCPPGFTC